MIALEKLARLMQEVVRERGPFALFGVFHRDGAPHDKWDLVVSAPWFDDEKVDALHEIAEKLRAIVD